MIIVFEKPDGDAVSLSFDAAAAMLNDAYLDGDHALRRLLQACNTESISLLRRRDGGAALATLHARTESEFALELKAIDDAACIALTESVLKPLADPDGAVPLLQQWREKASGEVRAFDPLREEDFTLSDDFEAYRIAGRRTGRPGHLESVEQSDDVVPGANTRTSYPHILTAWARGRDGREFGFLLGRRAHNLPLVNSVLEASTLPMMIIDQQERVLAINPAIRKLAPPTRKRLVGKRMRDFDALADVVRRRNPYDGSKLVTFGGGATERHFRPIEIPVDLAGRPCVWILYFDITKELEFQAQVQQTERARALEKLSSTLAHDLANVVTVLYSVLPLLKDGSPEDREEAVEDIASMLELSERLLKQLRNVDAEGVEASATFPLAPLVARVQRMFTGGDAHVEIDCPDDVAAWCSPSELERALINAVKNAIEAIESWEEASTPEIEIRVEPLDRAVVIEVEDNGPGIEVGASGELPDTTKGAGRGLGLPQIRNSIEDAGGIFTIDSSPGQGTVLRFRLHSEEPPRNLRSAPPAREEAAAEQQEPPQEDTDKQEDTVRGCVFIIDDHASVRRAMKVPMERLGWTVREFDSPAMALARFHLGEKPDAVVTDCVMAGGEIGTDLARWIQSNHPEIPVAAMTGYRESVLEGVLTFYKPVDIDALDAVLTGSSTSDARER